MKFDDGIVRIYNLTPAEDAGMMPTYTRTLASQHYYKERTVGYGRYYAAMGVNARIDMVVRIQDDTTVRDVHPGQLAFLNGGDYPFRIIQCQHLLDEDNLRVIDLSLQAIYDSEAFNFEDEEVTPDVNSDQP